MAFSYKVRKFVVRTVLKSNYDYRLGAKQYVKLGPRLHTESRSRPRLFYVN